jgi:LuxR family maltose regulon positive regulatory protein
MPTTRHVSRIAPLTPHPLVETKLHAPRRRQGVVHRARLANRLVRREQPPLTLVSAPAGFGKTTLLTEWFADGERATAWLSLDPRDNDAGLFWSYVVAALRTVVPDIGEAASSLLQSDPSALESVAATLLNDLDALVTDIVVVLDDYHVIESTDVHESLAFLLEHLPPQVHLVVASRSDPPLPLARMRARGELLEIRAADLRFTTGEASAYLREAMGLELSAEDVHALEARTEGWIAALQLAALSLQGRDDVSGFIASFTGDDRFVVDYLAEEVLERQSEEVRDFLLRTAILVRLTGSLCDAVTGGSGGTAMLESLERANLFVVPLDDQRRWYRYHHLFGDVLRARLTGEHAGLVLELHRRASDWFEAHGDRAEAIGHAMAGEDFERAARLIELAAPMMRQARQESTLRRWLEAIPGELFAARPVLSAALVGARMATGDSTGVEPLLQSAERWLDDRQETAEGPIVFDDKEFARLPAQVAMYRAALALLAGDIAGTISHAGRIFELADSSDHLRLGGASALTGLACWATADLEGARRHYADAIESFIRAGFIPDVLGCSLALADIQMAQGRLRDARRTLERGLELAHGQPGLRGTADMHVGLTEVHLDRNDLDAAARHLQKGRELGERAGLPQNAYRWRVAAARLLHAQGDTQGALELLDEAERFYNTDFSPAVRPIPALKARLHLDQGDIGAAAEWADDRGLTADDELDYVHEYEHITLARTLLAQHVADRDRLVDVIGLLNRLRAAAEDGRRNGRVVEVLVLLSRAHHARGDGPAAKAALEEALARARPEGLATGGADAPVPLRTGLVDELSSRELDVLRLLRTDLSGPDIARELLVSVNTFRTHTKNIYAKLGVNNRREATRRAAELGL